MQDDAPVHRAATARELTTERYALIVGFVILLAALTTISVVFVLDPPIGQRLFGQAAAHLIIGRETGLPTGLALGTPPLLVAALGATQDLIVLLVGYGLIMLAARGSLRIAWLGRLANRPHDKHEAFGARTEPAGIALLSLGLWIPFFPGGALVAALLARIAGYRPHVFLPCIAVSAVLADLAYVYALDRLAQLLPRWSLPFFVLGGLVLVAAVVWIRRRVCAARTSRSSRR
ncbi:MAG: hypothetical protein WDA16_15205 [Candidatus Thermoplasmatota archaeon]